MANSVTFHSSVEQLSIPAVGNLTIIAGEDSGNNNHFMNKIWFAAGQNNQTHYISAERYTALLLAQSAPDLSALNMSETMTDSMEFAQFLPELAMDQSVIAQNHPEIMQELQQIIGGSLSVNANGAITFIKSVPFGQDKAMPLALASAAVRSLAYIYLYVQYQAQFNEILFIEEPELSLHPRQQVRIARVLNMLVNAGVRVVITSHSDYIIREQSALIALGSGSSLPSDKDRKSFSILQQIDNSMLLNCCDQQINVYAVSDDVLQQCPVNQHGFTINTFENVMDEQGQLFDVADQFVSFQQESE